MDRPPSRRRAKSGGPTRNDPAAQQQPAPDPARSGPAQSADAGDDSTLPPADREAAQEAEFAIRTALDGVDFVTRLHLSATLQGLGFVSCCRRCGIDPQGLSAQRRRQIDEQMGSHFRRMADRGGTLAQAAAENLLQALLTRGTL